MSTDFIKDASGRHLLRLSQITQVPDYVKTAAVDADCIVTLGDHFFADPVHRTFPCDTPGHTYLSHAYCRSAEVGESAVRERIKLAAARHGITEDLDALDRLFDGLEKSASAQEPRYAIKIDFGQGNPESANAH